MSVVCHKENSFGYPGTISCATMGQLLSLSSRGIRSLILQMRINTGFLSFTLRPESLHLSRPVCGARSWPRMATGGQIVGVCVYLSPDHHPCPRERA